MSGSLDRTIYLADPGGWMDWRDGEDAFMRALSRIPDGYSEGAYAGRRWSATVKRSADGKRIWLYAEDLSGTDIVSFNLYALNRKRVLKPCEMSCAKVEAFVLQYRPDSEGSAVIGRSDLPEDKSKGLESH